MSSFSSAASKISREFDLTASQIQQATDHFRSRLGHDLEDSTAKNTQIPSFVSSVPNGTERGTYLVADLGGTNLRVCIVSLHGQSKYTIRQTKCAVPHDLMINDSWHPLFAFVAANIKSFLELGDTSRLFDDGQQHFLAFSFSFTVEQTSLHEGKLLRWDKGFDIPSAIGLDPCVMLQHELTAMSVPVHVVALVNDTVGTLMAQQYVSGARAVLGAVFGTGTNGSYSERLADIGKLKTNEGLSLTGHFDTMVLNTEWGGLDDECRQLPVTKFDLDLDRRSLHPGEQRFEKLVSGMYLGEIFRIAVLEARQRSDRHVLASLSDSSPLFQEWSIPTSLLSTLAASGYTAGLELRESLQQILRSSSLTLDEILGLKVIADAVGQRAGRLAGVAISAVIVKSGCLHRATLDPDSPRDGLRSELLSSNKLPSSLTRPLTVVFGNIGSRCCKPWKDPDSAWSLTGESSGYTSQVDDDVFVGLDGSLVALYPAFNHGIQQTLDQVREIGPVQSKRICMNIVLDGSSVGSALIAHAASQQLADSV